MSAPARAYRAWRAVTSSRASIRKTSGQDPGPGTLSRRRRVAKPPSSTRTRRLTKSAHSRRFTGPSTGPGWPVRSHKKTGHPTRVPRGVYLCLFFKRPGSFPALVVHGLEGDDLKPFEAARNLDGHLLTGLMPHEPPSYGGCDRDQSVDDIGIIGQDQLVSNFLLLP